MTREQVLAIINDFELATDSIIRGRIKLADMLVEGLGPRHLVSVCCLCGKEYGRKPLPEGYGKELPAKYQSGDLLSHGYCSACIKVVMPK